MTCLFKINLYSTGGCHSLEFHRKGIKASYFTGFHQLHKCEHCSGHFCNLSQLSFLTTVKINWDFLWYAEQTFWFLKKVGNDLYSVVVLIFWNCLLLSFCNSISIAGWILLLSLWMCSQGFGKLPGPYQWEKTYVFLSINNGIMWWCMYRINGFFLLVLKSYFLVYFQINELWVCLCEWSVHL